MPRPKKVAPAPDKVVKAAAPKVAKVFVSTPAIEVTYKKNIDQYLADKGVVCYLEGGKVQLTIDQIKELILNY